MLLLAANALAQSPAPVPNVTAYGTPSITGQPIAENRGSAALWQSLKQLRTWGSLMTIVAHPDDEDGGMLAYETRGLGIRTAIMTLTRGDGGQNAMSSATFDALALIRTNELLNADAYYGGSGITQYFGRVADYGFSKTMDEALAQWGHDRVLYDAVRAVRMNRPLVVTSTFVGGITDGHGHHQVAGLLAQEVFKYAGDPNYYPDQIAQGLRPWKPLKVYSRTPFFSITAKGMFDYATGKWSPVLFHNYVDGTEIHGALTTNVKVPEGTYDPVLGETYFQIARIGLGEQRSQHEGPIAPLAGEVSVGYHRFGALVPTKDDESSFFDGIDITLPGMAALAHTSAPFLMPALKDISSKVADASLNYIPAQPEKIAPALHDGYLLTAKLIDQVQASSLSDEDKYNLTHELRLKLGQFNDALVEALGLKLAAYALPPDRSPLDPKAPASALPLTPEFARRVAIPGSEVNVRLHIKSSELVKLTKTTLRTPEGETWPIQRLGAPGLDDPHSTSGDVVFRVTVPRDAQPTAPYFSRPSIEQAYYNLNDPRWLNHPFAPYPLAGEAEFDYDGVPLRLANTVQTSQMVDGLGGVVEPLLVAPALSLAMNGHAGIVPIAAATANHDFPLTITVHSNEAGNTDGMLKPELPAGWTASPGSIEFHLAQGETRSFDETVHPASLTTQTYMLKAVATSGNFEYSNGYVSAGYPGLRPYNLFTPASYSVTGVDVKVAPALKIGYVMGTGDDTPAALAELGITPRLLSSGDILNGDLSSYDTIMIGIRAYSSRPELATAKARLLAYVRGGGNLVVQYQSEFDDDYGPYPYTLGGSPERVVDETAPVVITNAQHPLLNFPNHITSADFDHWVEERGHSFMQSWSDKYTALTETHDPGEDPQRGGLLYARYGSGTYIYVAYALYRQTPEAVPGAFRLLANLVSAGKSPK
jgi:LmbE family N-acetylglucosaminyl deacetylase